MPEPSDSDAAGGGRPTENAGPVAEFAGRLRRLREEAGSPSFRHLARITHYSSSTLADATAGRRLPTEAVVRAFATACGAEPDTWAEALRDAAKAARGYAPGQRAHQDSARQDSARQDWGDLPAPDGGQREGATPPRRTARRRITVAAAVGAACGFTVLGAVLGAAASAPARHAVASTRTAGPTATPAGQHGARASDGSDPVSAGCAPDARLVDKSPVLSNGVQIGALELRYSARCQAGWARLYLYPGQPTGLGQVTVSAADGRLASFADPLVRQVPVYTDVIVPGGHGCLAARGEVSLPGRPPAAAVIPCQRPSD